MIRFALSLLLACLCGASLAFPYVKSHPIKRVIDDNVGYPEGPVFHDGNLYYAAYASQQIRVFAEGETTILWQQQGCGPSAIGVLPQGFLVACYDNNTLVEVSRQGKTLKVYDQDSQGKDIKGPNDLIVDEFGGIYFSASGAWDVSAPVEGAIYYFRNGTITQVSEKNIHYANGLALSVDGKTLVVAEHLANRIITFDVLEPGVLSSSSKVLFDLEERFPLPNSPTDIGPQGLFLQGDELFVAQHGGGRVLVLSLDGRHLDTIVLDHLWVSNVTVEGNEVIIASVSDYQGDYPGYVVSVDRSKILRKDRGFETLYDKASFPEGGLSKDGAYYFVEYGAGRINKLEEGLWSVFWQDDACGPTAIIDREGEFLVACYESGRLVRLDGSGELIGDISSKTSLKYVNDLTSDENGGLFVTVSGPWERQSPFLGKVLYLDSNNIVSEVVSDLHYPNGIAFDASKKLLYLNETLENRLLTFQVGPGGELQEKKVFVDLGARLGLPSKETPLFGPDGLYKDATGLYVAHYGYGHLVKVSFDGKINGIYKLPEHLPYVTNVFVHRDELFVTAATSESIAPFWGGFFRRQL